MILVRTPLIIYNLEAWCGCSMSSHRRLEDDTSIAVAAPASGTANWSWVTGGFWGIVQHCVGRVFVMQDLSGQIEEDFVHVGATSGGSLEVGLLTP